jgi:hypothetical protein
VASLACGGITFRSKRVNVPNICANFTNSMGKHKQMNFLVPSACYNVLENTMDYKINTNGLLTISKDYF